MGNQDSISILQNVTNTAGREVFAKPIAKSDAKSNNPILILLILAVS